MKEPEELEEAEGEERAGEAEGEERA